MQTPSIGRIVHVRWWGQTLPAIITAVHSPTEINATVFGQFGDQGCAHAAHLVHQEPASYRDAATHGDHRTWWWPPRVA